MSKKTTTKKAATKKTTNAAKATPKKAAAKKREGKMGALDAAAQVLAESKEPLNAKTMIEQMSAKGLWTSPGGKTPHATLYAAILREITDKGKDARFAKVDRGQFTINAGGSAPAKATGKKATKKAGKTKPADGTPGPKAVAELFKV
jgi:hypothetical protein